VSPISRLVAFFVVTLPIVFAGTITSQPPPPPFPDPPAAAEQPGAEVQPKGPLHEGFAQPFQLQPEPGPIVPKQPPQPIQEVPPNMKPEGANSQWIPGYWAWDSEKRDYLWISGTYRNAPQGRTYVPGYWTQEGEGWRWVQGYWAPASGPQAPLADASQYQPQFTPRPPAPLETGPNLPGPPDSIYYPGYWNYQNNSDFVWRPGFYSQGYANRIWIPPHYVWTPRGYVFVPGYWDYPLADRGLLFAPVTFASNYWNAPGAYYQPWYAVNAGLLLNNLFYNGPSFYFGNYYGSGYAGLGFRPWYGGAYSPYLGYYRWANRGNAGWYNGLYNGYAARGAGTLAPYSRGQVITPLNQVANARLTAVSAAQLNAQRAAGVRSQQLAQQRLRVETNRVVGAATPAYRPQVVNPAVHNPGLSTPYRGNVNHPVTPAISAPYRAAAPTYHATPAYHAAPVYRSNTATAHYTAPVYHASSVNHGRAVAPAHHSAGRSGGGHGGGHRR